MDTVIDKIPNHVKRVEDKNLEAWLAEANDTAKAILFTDKGKTSALLKAVAIDFKGSVSVAQIRENQKASVELFGVDKYPTLLLLPGGKEAEGVVYEGELKKDPIVKFLSQAATPNPDPAPAKVKTPKSKDSKKASKAKASFEKASASHESSEASASAASATEEVLEEEPTESPSPEVENEKPVPVPAPPISSLGTESDLEHECMGPRTGTCVLAILPATPNELALKAIESLSELAHKYRQHGRKVFPFYALTKNNPGWEKINEKLGFSGEMEVIAVNGRRGWWRQLPNKEATISMKDLTQEAIENWVESIKLGEGSKQKLPEGMIPEEPVVDEPVVDEPVVEESVVEEPVEEAQESIVTEEEPVVEEPVVEGIKIEEEVKVDPHDEL